MHGRKESYDLIFSIGEACSCSSAIRNSKLQIASYPFDWLFGSDYIGRCEILAGDFKRFIEKDDLELAYEERSIKCFAYHNKFNNITFNHDFLKELTFDEAYPIVKDKYDRRIIRLLSNINNANKVLVVYVETPTTNHICVSDETIFRGYQILKDHFGDKIFLIYVKYDKNIENYEQLNQNIVKVTCDYKNYDSELDYSVDKNKLKNLLSKYKLNVPISYRIKRSILKLLINFIPESENRRKMREKFHVQ